jgi:hypothetical protein
LLDLRVKGEVVKTFEIKNNPPIPIVEVDVDVGVLELNIELSYIGEI